MVGMGVWCDSALKMEVLSIGRSVEGHLDGMDCVLELTSRWLAYRVTLRGAWVWLFVSLMDVSDEPELLLRAADTKEGWDWARRSCPCSRTGRDQIAATTSA
jgi:hypothetical protein